MNLHAIYHKADSSCCFASGKREVTLRLRTAHNEDVSPVVLYNGKYQFRLEQLSANMTCAYSDGLFDYYTVTLSLAHPQFVYIFKLGELYFHEEGFSKEYDFAYCHLNSFQLPYVNETDRHTPVDWLKNAVFYQIFPDRFYRGDDDKNDSYINLKWGEIPTPKSFAGGDLKGIISKLEYIKSLGVTAIYLTPFFHAPSNHKYDTWDYFQIDPQFGTADDLRELVRRAHELEMRVVLDAVFNHCGEGLSQWHDVLKNGSQSPYFDWFVINGAAPLKEPLNYECFADCTYMPKLNTSNSDCARFLISVIEYWFQECNIDGWRLDVSDEIPHEFWRQFRKRVKSIKPDACIIGENWHDAEPFLRGDQYDCIMNYAFTKACMDYFAAETLDEQGLSDRLNNLLMRNTDMVNNMMLNMLDNHDTHRFLTLCGEDTGKMHAALALAYFFPGSVSVYYGTEIDLAGGFDPDCRRCFDWSASLSDTAVLIQKLAKIKEKLTGVTKIYCKNNTFYLTCNEFTLSLKDHGFSISEG